MTVTVGHDSTKTRKTLTAGGQTVAYYSIPAAEAAGLGAFTRLPAALKVVLENMLRFEDGKTVTVDDIRAFAIRQRTRIACHADAATRQSAMRRFGYIFEGEGGYPAIADLHHLPPHGQTWEVHGPSGKIPVVTFDQDHGGVRSVGYRFGDVAYSSDVVNLTIMGLIIGAWR